MTGGSVTALGIASANLSRAGTVQYRSEKDSLTVLEVLESNLVLNLKLRSVVFSKPTIN